MDKVDKVINHFRKLNEDGMVAASLPANRVGDGGCTSRGKEIAGLDPVMKFVRRKKVDYRTVPNNYKKWVKNIENNK